MNFRYSQTVLFLWSVLILAAMAPTFAADLSQLRANLIASPNQEGPNCIASSLMALGALDIPMFVDVDDFERRIVPSCFDKVVKPEPMTISGFYPFDSSRSELFPGSSHYVLFLDEEKIFEKENSESTFLIRKAQPSDRASAFFLKYRKNKMCLLDRFSEHLRSLPKSHVFSRMRQFLRYKFNLVDHDVSIEASEVKELYRSLFTKQNANEFSFLLFRMAVDVLDSLGHSNSVSELENEELMIFRQELLGFVKGLGLPEELVPEKPNVINFMVDGRHFGSSDYRLNALWDYKSILRSMFPNLAGLSEMDMVRRIQDHEDFKRKVENTIKQHPMYKNATLRLNGRTRRYLIVLENRSFKP